MTKAPDENPENVRDFPFAAYSEEIAWCVNNLLPEEIDIKIGELAKKYKSAAQR
jgi:hypothetical protein